MSAGWRTWLERFGPKERPVRLRAPSRRLHAEIDAIQEGDLIRFRKRLRKVRFVSRDPDGRLRMIAFAILRRSWTNQPYALYTRSDLYRGNFGGVVKRGTKLCAEDALECLTQSAIESCLIHRRHDGNHIRADRMAGKVQ